MAASAPDLPHDCPRKESSSVTFNGRSYPLVMEAAGWRMRSRSRSHPVDFRTGTTNLTEAKRRAKEWLTKYEDTPITSRKGGGSLEALTKLYLTSPKRTKANVAKDNVSRLRSICRATLGKELSEITCREISPDFWQSYQRIALEKAGRTFDLVTRYRENIAINSAVRVARCLFLPAFLRVYRSAGLDVRPDAGQVVMLPEPYVPPSTVDDSELVKAWEELAETNRPLWLTVGLARFAGLRREEITHCRAGWIEEHNGAVSVALRDRPEEKWWTKTGKPYRAQVIHPALTEWLIAIRDFEPPDKLVVPDPPNGDDRGRWFERAPQRWLHEHGVTSAKPLHRLRGLYADHVARLTSDAVTARLAAIRAAQKNLGHTSPATTEAHYLTPDALR